MTLEGFLELLRDVKPSGSGYTARCPAHDDTRNSLSIKAGPRSILVKCHAGCETKAVVTAMNLTLKDLFYDQGKRRERKREASRLVAAYDYRDADGVLLFQAVRLEPKQFFQRRPHPTRPDQWLMGLDAGYYVLGRDGAWYRHREDSDERPAGGIEVNALTQVCYRLDEIAALMPPRVVVVEGEKDADRLWELGIPATTNAAGAGKWRASYSDDLAGAGVRELILVPDHDAPGVRHMADVLKHSTAIGLQCRWLALPGVPDKGDTSDWLAACAPEVDRRRAFIALMDVAPLVKDPPADVAHFLGGAARAAAPAGVPPVPPDLGRYLVDELGRLCLIRSLPQGGTTVEALCNFDAWILEELRRDDGIEVRYEYKIQGRLETGEMLRPITLPADRYRGMGWVDTAWGAHAVTYAGQSKLDHLRVAIKVRSTPVSRRVFTHTGWREVDGHLRYLNGAGAIGDASVEVDIGPMSSRYRLPTVPTRAREGMTQSLRNLRHIGRRALIASIHGTLFRAPLCHAYDAPYTLYVVGKTGIGKTTLAALMMNHFGDFDSAAAFKYDWASSEGSIRELAFTMKDIVVALDDLVRHPNVVESRILEAKAATLIRAQANRTGKGRLTADLAQRDVHAPRGLIYITAETYVPGESVQARTFTINARKGDVDFDAVVDAMRARDLLREGMAGYIEWLAPQINRAEFRRSLESRTFELRQAIAEQASGRDAHPRVMEILAHVALGIEQSLQYAQEIGAATPSEADDVFAESWEQLLEATLEHGSDVAGLRPTTVFVELFQSLLLDRRLCLLKEYTELATHRAPPVPVGWVTPEFIYIIPGDGINQLYRALRDVGETFPIPRERLARELIEDGLARAGTDGKTSRVVKVSGRPMRCYVLLRRALEEVIGHPFVIPGLDDPPETSPPPARQATLPVDPSEPTPKDRDDQVPF
jgi:hypothetical protein